jgi:GNAT superfamily N-acetyltransferase
VRAGEQLVGMANALITVSTAEGCKVVLLEDVIIKASFRGQKLGQRLIDHILDWAIANGMPRVTLLADKDNAKALGFYERLGFTRSAMRVLRKETM